MKTLLESLSSSFVDDSKYNIFVMVKPGFLKDTQYIIEEFGKKGWVVNKIKTKQLLLSEAKKLYEGHKDKPYFTDLCQYTASEPVTAILFVKDVPMNEKKMFEETDKIKDKIRKKLSTGQMQNGIHSSDSLERLRIERGLFF